MSLDWNVGKIKNWKEVTRKKIKEGVTQEQIRHDIMNGYDYYYDEDEEGNRTYTSYLNPVTTALIWATIEIGLGRITEKNYAEFWMRMSMADGISGDGRLYEEHDDGKHRYRSVTLEEVKQHIGLRTNVSNITKTQFYNQMMKKTDRRVMDMLRREVAA